MSDDEREAYEERAAVAEFDGGLTRADAERLAWDEVIAEREAAELLRRCAASLTPTTKEDRRARS